MTTLFDHSWMTFHRASGVSVKDELHALYLKACQKKQADPAYAADPAVWPWVMAMWPHQPNPMGDFWVPGVRLGWALADPPENITRNRALPEQNRQIAQTVRALEGTVVEQP